MTRLSWEAYVNRLNNWINTSVDKQGSQHCRETCFWLWAGNALLVKFYSWLEDNTIEVCCWNASCFQCSDPTLCLGFSGTEAGTPQERKGKTRSPLSLSRAAGPPTAKGGARGASLAQWPMRTRRPPRHSSATNLVREALLSVPQICKHTLSTVVDYHIFIIVVMV